MKVLHHGKVVEKIDPTNVSTAAVARRVAYLKRHTVNDMDADMLEALAADRDRLALQNDALVAGMTELAERSAAALAEARGRIERAERAAVALERIASGLRHNESNLLAEIDDLKKRQMPWGV